MYGRPQESKHRRPPSPEKSKIHIGAFLSKWLHFLLRPYLGLPLLQKILWESMVVNKPDAVTVTKQHKYMVHQM